MKWKDVKIYIMRAKMLVPCSRWLRNANDRKGGELNLLKNGISLTHGSGISWQREKIVLFKYQRKLNNLTSWLLSTFPRIQDCDPSLLRRSELDSVKTVLIYDVSELTSSKRFCYYLKLKIVLLLRHQNGE